MTSTAILTRDEIPTTMTRFDAAGWQRALARIREPEPKITALDPAPLKAAFLALGLTPVHLTLRHWPETRTPAGHIACHEQIRGTVRVRERRGWEFGFGYFLDADRDSAAIALWAAEMGRDTLAWTDRIETEGPAGYGWQRTLTRAQERATGRTS